MRRSGVRWGRVKTPIQRTKRDASKKTKFFWSSAERRYQFYKSVALARQQQQNEQPCHYTTGFDYEALYGVTSDDIANAGGRSIVTYYGSIPWLLMMELPDHSWKPWRFITKGWIAECGSKFRAGDVIATICTREFFADMGQNLGLRDVTDWTKVIRRVYHESLVKHFGDWHTVLELLYPGKSHLVSIPAPKRSRKEKLKISTWKDVTGPDFWHDAKNRYEFMLFMKDQVGGNYEDMYAIPQQAFMDSGASALVRMFRGSSSLTVMNAFPLHHWQVWKFRPVPLGWWVTLANAFKRGDMVATATVREFMEEIEKRCNILKPEDWMLKTKKSVLGPDYVRFRYFGSVESVISQLYPGVKLRSQSRRVTLPPFYKHRVSITHWEDINNRLAYFNKLRQYLGGSLDDLYKTTPSMLLQTGANSLLSLYRGSVAAAIADTYRDHEWKRWKFRSTPQNWWTSLGAKFSAQDPEAVQTVREILADLEAEYNVVELEDWYRVSYKLLASNVYRLRALGGLSNVLQRLYPEHPWNWNQPEKHDKRTAQWKISLTVSCLLPQPETADLN